MQKGEGELMQMSPSGSVTYDKEIEYELFPEPLNILEKIGIGYSEMTTFEASYLCALLRENNPQKILEIGVSAGGTTAIMLNCLAMIGSSADFSSIDISEYWYQDPSKKSGFMIDVAKQVIQNCNVKHEFLVGAIPRWIDKVGDEIDFLILDTVHRLPGELLDFLVCLPYLKNGATVVLHDTMFHTFSGEEYRNGYATQVLLDVVKAKKNRIYRLNEEIFSPNIASFVIDEDTIRNVEDVFAALSLPWGYAPKRVLLKEYREQYVKNGYPRKCLDAFDWAVQNWSKPNETEILEELLSILSTVIGKDTYIYGAGVLGRKLLNIISNKCSFKGFIVSDDQEIKGETKKISSVEDQIGEGFVIVGVTRLYREQVAEVINKKGIKNVVYLSQDLEDFIMRQSINEG